MAGTILNDHLHGWYDWRLDGKATIFDTGNPEGDLHRRSPNRFYEGGDGVSAGSREGNLACLTKMPYILVT